MFARDDRGIAVLYAALLIPTFLILLAFVVELGALRATKARLTAAADLAATSAVNEQDGSALALNGQYSLSSSAAPVARELLAKELAPLAPRFAGTTPEAIAAGADIVATDRTTLRVSFDAPVRAPLLVLAALRDRVVIRIRTTAAAR